MTSFHTRSPAPWAVQPSLTMRPDFWRGNIFAFNAASCVSPLALANTAKVAYPTINIGTPSIEATQWGRALRMKGDATPANGDGLSWNDLTPLFGAPADDEFTIMARFYWDGTTNGNSWQTIIDLGSSDVSFAQFSSSSEVHMRLDTSTDFNASIRVQPALATILEPRTYFFRWRSGLIHDGRVYLLNGQLEDTAVDATPSNGTWLMTEGEDVQISSGSLPVDVHSVCVWNRAFTVEQMDDMAINLDQMFTLRLPTFVMLPMGYPGDMMIGI